MSKSPFRPLLSIPHGLTNSTINTGFAKNAGEPGSPVRGSFMRLPIRMKIVSDQMKISNKNPKNRRSEARAVQ